MRKRQLADRKLENRSGLIDRPTHPNDLFQFLAYSSNHPCLCACSHLITGPHVTVAYFFLSPILSLSLPHTFLLISFSFFFITPFLFPFLSFLSSSPVRRGWGVVFFSFWGGNYSWLGESKTALREKSSTRCFWCVCVRVPNSEKIIRRFSEWVCEKSQDEWYQMKIYIPPYTIYTIRPSHPYQSLCLLLSLFNKPTTIVT